MVLRLFKPKQRTILGIDLNAFAVKFLLLTKSAEKIISVINYGYALLPVNTIENNIIKDVDALVDCIKKLLSPLHLSNKLVTLAIPDALTMSHVQLFHTDLTLAETEALVFIEAEKIFPYPLKEMHLDFQILNSGEITKKMQEILIIASKNENIDQRISAIKRVGLRSNIMDVESFAIGRVTEFLLKNLPDIAQNKIIGVLRLDSAAIHLLILDELRIIFVHEEPLVDSNLTVAMNANKQREQHDFINSCLNAVLLETIIEQIKKILKFFFISYPKYIIDHVFICGDLAIVAHIHKLIQQNTNIATWIMNPFKYMYINKELNQEELMKIAPSLIVACGLALRSI